MSDYEISRSRDGTVTCTVSTGKGFYPLPHRVHHSPTGFEVGYAGSGPADLALSILDDFFDADRKTVEIYDGTVGSRAWSLHQQFKAEFLCYVNPKPGQAETIYGQDIATWVHQLNRFGSTLHREEVARA